MIANWARSGRRGARRNCSRRSGRRARIGFATSAQPDELRPLLEIIDAADLLDAAANSGDVSKSKPDPDIVHAALEKNGLAADEKTL